MLKWIERRDGEMLVRREEQYLVNRDTAMKWRARRDSNSRPHGS